MELKSNGFVMKLSFDEVIALATLLGNMSKKNMMDYGDVTEEEATLLQVMYGTLSAFVPVEEAG